MAITNLNGQSVGAVSTDVGGTDSNNGDDSSSSSSSSAESGRGAADRGNYDGSSNSSSSSSSRPINGSSSSVRQTSYSFQNMSSVRSSTYDGREPVRTSEKEVEKEEECRLFGSTFHLIVMTHAEVSQSSSVSRVISYVLSLGTSSQYVMISMTV